MARWRRLPRPGRKAKRWLAKCRLCKSRRVVFDTRLQSMQCLTCGMWF